MIHEWVKEQTGYGWNDNPLEAEECFLRKKVEGDIFPYNVILRNGNPISFKRFSTKDPRPKEKWVPWENIEECTLKRGDWLVTKQTQRKELPIQGFDRDKDFVKVCDFWHSLRNLFDEFLQTDGTPCGKKVEE